MTVQTTLLVFSAAIIVILSAIIVWLLLRDSIHAGDTAEHIADLMNRLEQERTARIEAENRNTETLASDNAAAKAARRKTEPVSASLLRDKGETVFRDRFMQSNPSFAADLRQQVPALGRREELLCMLIALDIEPEVIAALMCISRNSVNMSRHRLRRKLNLDRETSLETYLQDLCK